MSVDKSKLESVSGQLGQALQQAIEANGLSEYIIQSIKLTEKKDKSQKGVPQDCRLVCSVNSSFEVTCELRC
ncbi:hypothetical protein [Pseudomonas sp. SJZ131]|uniref:hypothetical protein n=1 Tax=Pseudomonas sp. SJZ131 TaxID=2572895 RepID=UPI00119A3DB4|nr:hypothetical protein [Pseudomonas sp. SJZ131]TWD52493.1 hypothetical protein FBY12_1018 [Pseudomonas sp. SJZ131]